MALLTSSPASASPLAATTPPGAPVVPPETHGAGPVGAPERANDSLCVAGTGGLFVFLLLEGSLSPAVAVLFVLMFLFMTAICVRSRQAE